MQIAGLRKLSPVLMTLVFFLMPPHRAHASNGADSYTGGTFTTGSAVGQNISVQLASLSPASASLSFSCPITSYGAGTYAVNWNCAGGSVTITSTDKSLVLSGKFLSGTMSFSGSGGGRGGHTTYYYQFYGTLSGTITAAGVTQAANGSVSQYVKTSAPVGSGGAPVTAGSFGWNSAYAPLIVNDPANSRLVAADNITGTNLATYGSAGTGVGQFGTIAGLAQDAGRRIYASDSALSRIVRVDDLTGLNWTSLGAAGAGVDQFQSPQGVTIDASGKLWVADAGNNRIVRADDMTGANWTAFGTAGAGVNQFSAPSAIALDATGRIYIADTGNNRIVRIDDMTGKNWAVLTEILIDPYGYPITAPGAIAIDAAGNIDVITSTGYLLSMSDITGANPTVVSWGGALTGMSLDKSGSIYVAGTFVPGLGQVANAQAAGYFASNLGGAVIQPTVVLATASSTPPPPAPLLTASALPFGYANVGEATAQKAVYLVNFGGQPLAVDAIASGADFPESQACPPLLAQGAYCRINVAFKPATIHALNEELSVSTNGAHPVLGVSLSGFGTYTQPVYLPHVLTFDPQATGTTSGAQTVTLTNNGTGPLTLASIAASADFIQTSNCPKQVLPKTGCTLQVSYKPSAAGARTGTVTIADDAVATGAQQTIALSGTGTTAAPAFMLSPEALQFPSQQVATSSVQQTVVLTNSSGAKISLGSPVYATGFKGTTTCGATLASAAACSFSVRFAPAAAGPVTGALTVPVAGQDALSVGLSGTGVTAGGAAILSPNPAAIDFGQISTGDNPSMSTVLTNPTAVALSIQSIAYAGSSLFSITNNTCPAVLNGHASCSVEITYLPVAVTGYADTGTLTITEGSGAQTAIPVTGVAIAGGN